MITTFPAARGGYYFPFRCFGVQCHIRQCVVFYLRGTLCISSGCCGTAWFIPAPARYRPIFFPWDKSLNRGVTFCILPGHSGVFFRPLFYYHTMLNSWWYSRLIYISHRQNGMTYQRNHKIKNAMLISSMALNYGGEGVRLLYV